MAARDVNIVLAPAEVPESKGLKKLLKPPAASASAGKKDGLPTLEGRAFVRVREEQTAALMALYVERLGVEAVPVVWSKRLNKTAGQTRCSRSGTERSAAIELATKVVDSTAKLRCTLAHEMCHAEAWVVEESSKPPHGDVFKRWARRFESEFGVEISTCHSYDIAFKYRWECSGCGQTVGRHSKSFDPHKYRCGACRGEFVQI